LSEIVPVLEKIRAGPRAVRLEQGLSSWRHRFADRIFAFTEAALLAYDDIIAPRRAHDRGRWHDRSHPAH
jgi:hypothetical protein